MPQPDILGRNGTYVAFRKLHQRVAAFRQYLRDNASSDEGVEWLAAKMMGRWRSGAPLALCPLHDDPELGADPLRNNDFVYADDPTCAGRTYTAGQSFVDRGDETVHTALNLGATNVELWATYLVPGDPGAAFRIDAADPACDF